MLCRCMSVCHQKDCSRVWVVRRMVVFFRLIMSSFITGNLLAGLATLFTVDQGWQPCLRRTRAGNLVYFVPGLATLYTLYQGRQPCILCTRAGNLVYFVPGHDNLVHFCTRDGKIVCSPPRLTTLIRLTRADNLTYGVRGFATLVYFVPGLAT